MTEQNDRLEALRARAREVERRADDQPTWMKGALVFADRPPREALPELKAATPETARTEG